jgi:hypothetical protein
MKRMLFISGLVALVQALLIVVTGAFEVYNSYQYTITPISDRDGLGGGTIVLVAPFTLFLVALYFFLFFACSLVSAIFLFRRSYLRICLVLTLVVGTEPFFDAWVICLRHDYWWIWVPAARILLAIAILYWLRAYVLSEQTA